MTSPQNNSKPQDGSNVPRLSIGLPVYNGAKYLPEAVKSLLAQTYGDFELILSDNASNDGTQATCEAYASSDHRIRYVRQECNRGLVWNWNHVFELSNGSYFKWASDDDLYHRTYLERCVEILDQYPDVTWCHTLGQHIDHEGQPLFGDNTPHISHLNSGQDPRRPWSRNSDRPSARFKAVLLGCNGLDCYGMIRSDTLRETALFLPHYGSEKVLTSELALRGQYYEVPEVLHFARIHEHSAGNLHSRLDQRRLINPYDKTWHSDRLSLLRGYFRSVHRAELPLAERLRCYLAIGHYVMQFGKWKSILKKTMTGAGLAADYPVAHRRISRQAIDT